MPRTSQFCTLCAPPRFLMPISSATFVGPPKLRMISASGVVLLIPTLNTMFNTASNMACNNILFKTGTLNPMPQMHYSMARLYEAAKEKGVIGQSAVARSLNVSPQRVKNWESRGISEQGARLAQSVFGCNANALMTPPGLDGKYPIHTPTPPLSVNERRVEYISAPQSDPLTTELLALFKQLDDASKQEYIAFLKGFVAGRRPHEVGQASSLAG